MGESSEHVRTAAQQQMRLVQRRVLVQMGVGVTVMAIPVAAWWYWSTSERKKVFEEYNSRVKLPAFYSSTDTYDYMITEKMQPGDIVVFQRRCERCATSPWAALACYISQKCLDVSSATHKYDYDTSVNRYDHIGLIVPGYTSKSMNTAQRPIHRSDDYDPTNLLVLEATASGIVARPIKERLELSSSASVLLVQLACPGEQRNNPQQQPQSSSSLDKKTTRTSAATPTSSSQIASVTRTRNHVERELERFRDTWVKVGNEQHYANFHSTVTLGGAVMYRFGWHNDSTERGTQSSWVPPIVVSPAAYLVLMGLQAASGASNSISESKSRAVKASDFLRDCRRTEQEVVQLRPGWRFLPPIPLKQASSGRYT